MPSHCDDTNKAAAIEPVDARPVNILIVDDEPRNLTVLESILDQPDYRLVRANSGDEALLALMADQFAVLVLDIRMPGMSGFELAQMVKERRRTARVPIIFLTAYYNEDQHMLEGYGSGAVDYLHKPVNPAVLRSKVAVFAELYRQGRELEQINRRLEEEVAERRRTEMRLQELNETLDRRVTERTRALNDSEAQLRQASRRKDEFLATLAHELRNPLAPVRSALHLLRLTSSGDARQVRATQVMERQVQLMTRLIDDLMDVGRITQGKIELQQEMLEIGTVIQDAIEMVQPLITELEHELVVRRPPEAVLLKVDRTRMAQVLLNLLHNAAKYMDPRGLIDLTVSLQEASVQLSVRDRGVGIPPDRLGEVFELFSQVESTLSRARGGLGIGLALTQRLVALHGGSIEAFSEGSGHGSEFVVRLPLSSVPSPADPAPAPHPRRPAPLPGS
ncbi:hybrid sensor histidine kinase/response regulator [Ramlibacter rhizophilus]|uniref:histidine kinase n=1 Tax=Ramlibacter rhizophilus TaxID=1781167 RepID=A0A4Z0BI14_9BURK|nr:hybrid sensor histidine kinase/response regulator [Ramlibacter rhizophilus]TFY97528.1 hybrid sensor histidine kinase/response regulator [Ramlibacter rhizophilus]